MDKGSLATQAEVCLIPKILNTEKEALEPLIWACEKFEPFIYGLPFELVTDHKPLD